MRNYWKFVISFIVINYHNILCKEDNIEVQYIRAAPINDYILCRSCGNGIADSYDLLNKLSPNSRSSFNDTLFKRDKTLIQILSNSISYDFAVITSAKASCEGVGEWLWNESWFPGYISRVCTCPDCGAHIGWVFEPTDILPDKKFFGLILSELIGESCMIIFFKACVLSSVHWMTF